MTASINLGYNRIGNVTVVVIDESMIKEQHRAEIHTAFMNNGYMIASRAGDDLTAVHNGIKDVYLENSPVMDTLHMVRAGDFQVVIHARTLASFSKKEAAAVMTFIEEAEGSFSAAMKFHGNNGTVFSNEQAYRNVWTAIAKVHGSDATWSLYRSMFFKYVKQMTQPKGFRAWVQSCVIAYAGTTKTEYAINMRKAILGK